MTATARNDESTDDTLELTPAEKHPPTQIPSPPTKPLHVAWRRLTARKAIHVIAVDDEKKELADKIAGLALEDRFKTSDQAILIFVRTVEDVDKIVNKLNKEKQLVRALTGTMRGLERDRMVDPRKETGCPIFARFLPPPTATPELR